MSDKFILAVIPSQGADARPGAMTFEQWHKERAHSLKPDSLGYAYAKDAFECAARSYAHVATVLNGAVYWHNDVALPHGTHIYASAPTSGGAGCACSGLGPCEKRQDGSCRLEAKRKPDAQSDESLGRQFRDYFGHITPEEACRTINELHAKLNAAHPASGAYRIMATGDNSGASDHREGAAIEIAANIRALARK